MKFSLREEFIQPTGSWWFSSLMEGYGNKMLFDKNDNMIWEFIYYKKEFRQFHHIHESHSCYISKGDITLAVTYVGLITFKNIGAISDKELIKLTDIFDYEIRGKKLSGEIYLDTCELIDIVNFEGFRRKEKLCRL